MLPAGVYIDRPMQLMPWQAPDYDARVGASSPPVQCFMGCIDQAWVALTMHDRGTAQLMGTYDASAELAAVVLID